MYRRIPGTNSKRIARSRQEIVRLENEIEARSSSRGAAEKLFPGHRRPRTRQRTSRFGACMDGNRTFRHRS
ncbi:DUF1192 family protein [Pararhizobium mangrovi]|uniref:DUF1192 domain-containing protein n=1 Tax=Pararhizobium mangrovi TaxID=2590452 RepID=A0A506U6S1_9HYPH|nr:DUF1192 domain-containing protein [Pararhizobium mangrovi]